MRVLLDECVPRNFKSLLVSHECPTVPEEGLAGRKNGELLALAERAGFQVFLTLDRGLEYQQNPLGRIIAIILVRARSNRLADLLLHGPEVLRVLDSIKAGDLAKVG